MLLPADGNIPGGLTPFPEPAECAAWILTGGRSSRMGRDKALITLDDGVPLAVRAANEALSVCGRVSLVGERSKYEALGFPVVEDRYKDVGPLGGIEAALSETTADWNLIVACDMPGIGAPLFRLLFENLGVDGVAPVGPSGHPEPLCGVYHCRAHSAFVRALEAGRYKVIDALAPLALRYLEVTEDQMFANLNTPEDLGRWKGDRARG